MIFQNLAVIVLFCFLHNTADGTFHLKNLLNVNPSQRRLVFGFKYRDLFQYKDGTALIAYVFRGNSSLMNPQIRFGPGVKADGPVSYIFVRYNPETYLVKWGIAMRVKDTNRFDTTMDPWENAYVYSSYTSGTRLFIKLSPWGRVLWKKLYNSSPGALKYEKMDYSMVFSEPNILAVSLASNNKIDKHYIFTINAKNGKMLSTIPLTPPGFLLEGNGTRLHFDIFLASAGSHTCTLSDIISRRPAKVEKIFLHCVDHATSRPARVREVYSRRNEVVTRTELTMHKGRKGVIITLRIEVAYGTPGRYHKHRLFLYRFDAATLLPLSQNRYYRWPTWDKLAITGVKRSNQFVWGFDSEIRTLPYSEATVLYFGTDANLTGEVTKSKGLLYLNGTAGEDYWVRSEFWALRIDDNGKVTLFNANPEVCGETTAESRGIRADGVAMRPLHDRLFVTYDSDEPLIGGEFKGFRDFPCVIPVA